ncbi:hypothetical protein, partial [Streptomyces bacillaris]|uniref:hypothetical protein n=1 Tax=Streptomyces bacillaris TaxID=68179 RepID=UPI00364A7A15
RHPAQPRHDRLNQQVKHHPDLPTPTLLQQPLKVVAQGPNDLQIQPAGVGQASRKRGTSGQLIMPGVAESGCDRRCATRFRACLFDATTR